MSKVFEFFALAVIFVTLLMLIRVFKGPRLYDRLIGILVIGTNVILILILIGFAHGRHEMYVDIAISYAVLGFFSSVIVAKFLSSRGGKNGD